MILFRRAVWISVPVLMIVTGLACINGLVMYAVFANCDPLTAGEIQRNDQVLKNKHFENLPYCKQVKACGLIFYSLSTNYCVHAV